MNRSKASVPLVLAGVCLAVLAGEIGWLRQVQARAKRSGAALERVRQERDRLLRVAPAPTVENERAITAAWAEARRTLEALQAGVGGKQEAGPAPAGPVEAFFELGRFAEEMREKARAARVAVKPLERFGFGRYASHGPEAALLPVVHRQRVVAAAVLAALFEARPLALLEVKREMPGVRDDTRIAPADEDAFTLPPSLSLRQAGLLESDALRFEFTGQTGVLREFLNTLAALPQPVVVRAVEVEPFRPPVATSTRSGPEAEALQRKQVSKFAVTLEIPRFADPGSRP